MPWSIAGTLQYGPDFVLGISDLVRFTPIWSDLVIRVTPRPLIGRDITRVLRAIRKVPHKVRSSHCFVSRPNAPYCSIAESRCICIVMTTVFGQLFVSVT